MKSLFSMFLAVHFPWALISYEFPLEIMLILALRGRRVFWIILTCRYPWKEVSGLLGSHTNSFNFPFLIRASISYFNCGIDPCGRKNSSFYLRVCLLIAYDT